MRSLLLFLILFPSLGRAITLDEAMKSADENSHEIKQLKLAAESTRWGEEKAFAGFLPRLDVEGRHLFSENFEILELEFQGTNVAMPAIQPYTSLGLTASIELFSGFQTLGELRAARAERAAAEHRLKRAQDRLHANLRTLFYRALGSQILVVVAQQNIETLDAHLRDVNLRVRSGVSTRYDALRTEVQLEDARTEKVAVENMVAVARAQFFEAIGLEDDGHPLVGKLPEDFSRYDVKKIKSADVQREDRVAQHLTLESQERLSTAAKAHWYPHVSLFANQEWYNNTSHAVWDADERFKNAYAVGVQLKWNIFDGGAQYASQRQAEISRQIAFEKLAQIDQATPVEIEEAKRKLSYNVINYKAKLSSIRKAEEAVRLARGGLKAGTRTNTEVLDAAVDLNRAKAASVKSQVEAIEALGQLELAVGHEL